MNCRSWKCIFFQKQLLRKENCIPPQFEIMCIELVVSFVASSNAFRYVLLVTEKHEKGGSRSCLAYLSNTHLSKENLTEKYMTNRIDDASESDRPAPSNPPRLPCRTFFSSPHPTRPAVHVHRRPRSFGGTDSASRGASSQLCISDSPNRIEHLSVAI